MTAAIIGLDDDKLPQGMSPSRASDFVQCPAKYYMSAVRRLREPATAPQLLGNLAHYAYEQAFSLPRDERVADTVVGFVDDEVARFRSDPAYQHLLGEDDQAAAITAQAKTLVRNWFDVERPHNFDPVGIEMVVKADLGGFNIYGIIDRVDRVVRDDGTVKWFISDYKGLAVDTPLPTPTGWTTMGDVEVGGQLTGADGTPTTVTVKSATHHRPCYRITFDDGSTIVADNVHLWQVDVGFEGGGATVWATRVVSTDGLAGLLNGATRQQVRIVNAAPLQLPAVDVGVNAYFAGVGAAGGDISEHTQTAGGAGLAERFLRGSVTQRLDVLQGVLDTAGHWCSTSNRAILVTGDSRVADLVAELTYSLGGTVEHVTTLEQAAGNMSAVAIRPNGWNPFRSTNNQHAIVEQSATSSYRTITAVREVASVPTQCVKVDAADSLYLAGKQMVPTHNTGKVPGASSMYLDEKFFQLRSYAVALNEIFGITVEGLRLVYTARGKRDDVRTRPCDTKVMTRTKKKLQTINEQIVAAKDSNTWVCKVQRLCDWCAYQPVCPAFVDSFADGDSDRIAAAFIELQQQAALTDTPLQQAAPVAVTVTTKQVTADAVSAGTPAAGGGVVDISSPDYAGASDNW